MPAAFVAPQVLDAEPHPVACGFVAKGPGAALEVDAPGGERDPRVEGAMDRAGRKHACVSVHAGHAPGDTTRSSVFVLLNRVLSGRTFGAFETLRFEICDLSALTFQSQVRFLFLLARRFSTTMIPHRL